MDYFSSLNASALDPDTPTLFELLSAKELDDLISPSIRYIITFYAQRHPRYLLRVANRFDEIYGLAMGLVEYYHLKYWNSSFTEKFYGLKRTNLLNTPALRAQFATPNLVEQRRRLTRKQIWGSLVMIVAVPYVKEKLDVRYERLKGQALVKDMDRERQRIQGDRSVDLKTKMLFEIDYWFYKIYPLATSAHHLATLLFYLGFLFGRTTSHSVSDYLLGIKFSRMSNFDYQLDDERNRPPMTTGGGEDASDEPMIAKVVNFFTTKQGLNVVQSSALSVLSYALPTSMFLLKFLEWWSGSDLAHRLASKSRGALDDNLPTPKSLPEMEDKKRQVVDEKAKVHKSVSLVRDTSLCPICGERITNPTVIESGITFCYPCIYKHLENSDRETGGHCPVTGQRLLQCRFQEETSEWEIGGLRRLMI